MGSMQHWLHYWCDQNNWSCWQCFCTCSRVLHLLQSWSTIAANCTVCLLSILMPWSTIPYSLVCWHCCLEVSCHSWLLLLLSESEVDESGKFNVRHEQPDPYVKSSISYIIIHTYFTGIFLEPDILLNRVDSILMQFERQFWYWIQSSLTAGIQIIACQRDDCLAFYWTSSMKSSPLVPR